MASFEVITISEDLEELLWNAASSLKDKIEVPTGRDGWQLFSHTVTEECDQFSATWDKAMVLVRKNYNPTFAN